MPEAFRKLNCKLCVSDIETTHQILKDMLPKFMRLQKFYCKSCETKFVKVHLIVDHIILSSSCGDTEFYFNHVKLVLKHPVR